MKRISLVSLVCVSFLFAGGDQSKPACQGLPSGSEPEKSVSALVLNATDYDVKGYTVPGTMQRINGNEIVSKVWTLFWAGARKQTNNELLTLKGEESEEHSYEASKGVKIFSITSGHVNNLDKKEEERANDPAFVALLVDKLKQEKEYDSVVFNATSPEEVLRREIFFDGYQYRVKIIQR